jgi:hypothetical protein
MFFQEELFKYELNAETYYTLSDSEQKVIIEMAETICQQDRSHFLNNYKIDKNMSFFDMNKNGFGAELSFCRLTDSVFDSTTIEKDNHFLKPDTILNNGLSVDVKTTIYNSGKLLVRIGKEKKPFDLFVLMVGKFPTYRFCGYAKFDEVINEENISDLGWGKGYVLPQHKLHKVLNIF